MKNAKEAFTGKRVETVLETAAVALDTKEATVVPVAMSGLELNAAAGRPEEWAERAPDALFAAVNQLEGSAERARVLWALHALGKASEQEELSQKLVEELAHSDPTGFRWESWQLLRELQPLLSKEEDAETPCPFTTIWKEGLTASLEAETATFRDCPRRSELASALEELADAEEPELGAVAGPFCTLPAKDMHHTVVSRVLRRQLWAKLLPDFQVKEISLADWDKATLLDEPQFTERAAWISQVMRSQAEGMLSKLGPDMEPPENTPLGVGASVAAAVILASLVKDSLSVWIALDASYSNFEGHREACTLSLTPSLVLGVQLT
eukprot:g17463.t1